MPSEKEKLPLSVTHPDLAKEADGWDPNDFTSGSGKKVDWLCKSGHEYSSSISHRTNMKSGCPYCARKKTLKGFNDLQTLYPGIAAEAEGWNPDEFGTGSQLKQKWRCPSGHIYESTISHRTILHEVKEREATTATTRTNPRFIIRTHPTYLEFPAP